MRLSDKKWMVVFPLLPVILGVSLALFVPAGRDRLDYLSGFLTGLFLGLALFSLVVTRWMGGARQKGDSGRSRWPVWIPVSVLICAATRLGAEFLPQSAGMNLFFMMLHLAACTALLIFILRRMIPCWEV